MQLTAELSLYPVQDEYMFSFRYLVFSRQKKIAISRVRRLNTKHEMLNTKQDK